jgi:outer membrane receptor protein involved in Fe transport
MPDRRHGWVSCVTLAIVCGTATTPVFAGGLQGEATQLDPIVVTAETLQAGTSASQGVVTAEQLANRPRLRAAELLEVVPGLIVTQHSGDGKANQYFLRGFNLDHGTDFRTTVDGMPVNMPTHGHGQGYSDLNFVIPELVSRIRYRKGTYYAEEGDFSAAGAAELEYFNRLEQTLVQAEAGEDGYRRGVLAGSRGLGGGDVLYGFSGAVNDGPWDVPEDLRKLNGVLRYTRPLGSGELSVSGMGYDSRWTSTDQIPRRAVEQGRIGRYGSLDDSDGGETSRYSLSASWQGATGASAWRASTYWIDYDLSLFSNFTYVLDDPANGDQFEQHDARRIAGGELRFERHGDLAGLHMHHLIGAELRYDDIGGVGLYRTRRRVRLATVREDSVDQLSYGLYYSNTAQWRPWLRSTAGVRGDVYRFDVDADRPQNSGREQDALISPKLSLVLGPWRSTDVFLNAGYGFHSNDARGTTISVDPVSGEPVEPVDPLVRAKGYEAGLRTRWLPQLQTAVTVWRLTLDSELLFVGDAGTTEASRPSRRTGIEIANYWTPLRHVIVDADAAWSRARFRDGDPAGDRIPGAIGRTASLGVVVDGLRGGFGGLRLRYFGGRPLVEDGSVRSSSSTLVNARLGYAPTPRLRVTVDVLNLFDRELSDIDYFYTSRLPAESEPVDDVHFHPAEPRTLRLGLALHF